MNLCWYVVDEWKLFFSTCLHIKYSHITHCTTCMQNNSASNGNGMDSLFFLSPDEWMVHRQVVKMMIKRQKSTFDYQVRSRRRVVWGLMKSTVPEDGRRVSVWNYVGLCSSWTMWWAENMYQEDRSSGNPLSYFAKSRSATGYLHCTVQLADDDSGWLS